MSEGWAAATRLGCYDFGGCDPKVGRGILTYSSMLFQLSDFKP